MDHGEFLRRISMGEYPKNIGDNIGGCQIGEQPSIIGVVMELESNGDSSIVVEFSRRWTLIKWRNNEEGVS